MRIAVSPDFRERHEDDLRRLEVRAEDLDCIVSTYATVRDRTDEAEYIVKVRRGSKVTKLRGEGSLIAVIEGALDDFENEYGEPWSAEEILTIADQSGLDVTRA